MMARAFQVVCLIIMLAIGASWYSVGGPDAIIDLMYELDEKIGGFQGGGFSDNHNDGFLDEHRKIQEQREKNRRPLGEFDEGPES